MDRYQSELARLAEGSNEVRDGEFADGAEVMVAGVVSSLAVRMTKDAEKFAILRLEDLRGSVEVMVWKKTYAECADLLKVDEPLLVKGRVRARGEEEPSVGADRVTSLAQHRAGNAQRLTLNLESALAGEGYPRLMGMLAKSPGRCAVRFAVRTEAGHRVLLDSGVAVAPGEGLVDELAELFSGRAMEFEYPKDDQPAAPRRVAPGGPRGMGEPEAG
jgi:DNA polymerase-3 subunit alpha